MADLLFISLTAGVLAMMGLMIATEIDEWRKRRRHARIRRIKRDLAETQRDLQALALQHETWLNGQAHEARKALIMESFEASRSNPSKAHDRARSQKHNGVLRHP